MRRRVFLIISAFSALALPADAQVDAGLTAAIPRCLDIRDPAERLACFERAARTIQAEMRESSTTNRASDASKPTEFGMSRRKAGAMREKVEPQRPAIHELSGVIAAVATAGNGYRLSLADGSEWNVTNSSLGRAPAKGDRILIEAGVLSGYRATIPGKAGLLRVRRLR